MHLVQGFPVYSPDFELRARKSPCIHNTQGLWLTNGRACRSQTRYDYDESGYLDAEEFELLISQVALQDGFAEADEWMRLHVGSYVGSI